MAEKTIPSPTLAPAAGEKGKDDSRDAFREICETVVFVVVLVLMLKTFVAEAFVIPTGSMAETLYGYHRPVTCDECRHEFQVNCSSEADPQHGQRMVQIKGAICPNCHNPVHWKPYVPTPFGERLPILAVFGAGAAGLTYASFYLHGKVRRDKVAKDSALYASILAAVIGFKGADILLFGPPWNTGDRVLVAKFLYDRDKAWKPRRHETIVFKFPRDPQQGTTAMNYIKRCTGLPEETVAIFDGDLYTTRALTYADREADQSERLTDRWRPMNMFPSDPTAVRLFEESMRRAANGQPQPGDFEIVRRSPEVMLAMRRIVFDADHQPADLIARGIRRWQAPQGRWSANDPPAGTVFSHTPTGDDFAWLTYNHLLGERERQERDLQQRPEVSADVVGKLRRGPLDTLYNVNVEPVSGERRLITNMMGYNTGEGDPNQDPLGHYWVSDLMLECEIKVEDAQGEFVLELSKARDRFRAVFNVASGECTLERQTGLSETERAANRVELGRQSTSLKGPGTYRVRFANVDSRLTVWVNSKMPFQDGVAYPPGRERAPTAENDLDAPARVGARGGRLTIAHLQLWRDTFYTHMEGRRLENAELLGGRHVVQTLYVQPGHYLCLGDNSASSADSREWGLVPERLLLGRALVIYFPFWPFERRFGLIR